MSLQRICVFCGSSAGSDPLYGEAAHQLGTAMARADVGLVYGGADIGLMGAVADAALAAGGEVIGVIPDGLADREIAHRGLTELIVADDMHSRKRKMYELSDGFCALPGGYGTLDEIFEAATWSQLGQHVAGARKPLALLNVDGFWDPLSTFLNDAVQAGFVKAPNRGLVAVADNADHAIAVLRDNAVGASDGALDVRGM